MTRLQARVEALRHSCERAMNAPHGSKALISYQAGRYDALGDVLLLLAMTRPTKAGHLQKDEARSISRQEEGGVHMKHYRLIVYVVAIVALLLTTSCAQNPPPTLSPAGVTAWQATKVIKALDVVRDIAVDASNATPPLVAHDTMLQIVAWHKTAIAIAHEAPTDWRQAITISLASAQGRLTPAEHRQLDPYFALTVTVLNEVP